MTLGVIEQTSRSAITLLFQYLFSDWTSHGLIVVPSLQKYSRDPYLDCIHMLPYLYIIDQVLNNLSYLFIRG